MNRVKYVIAPYTKYVLAAWMVSALLLFAEFGIEGPFPKHFDFLGTYLLGTAFFILADIYCNPRRICPQGKKTHPKQ